MHTIHIVYWIHYSYRVLLCVLRRAYVPPPLPQYQPIRDDYLVSFGRSYSETKGRKSKAKAAEDKTQKTEGDDGSLGVSVEKSGDVNDGEQESSEEDSSSDGGRDGGADDRLERHSSDMSFTSDDEADGAGSAANPEQGKRKLKHGIFVTNVPYHKCNEASLSDIFKGYGTIMSINANVTNSKGVR